MSSSRNYCRAGAHGFFKKKLSQLGRWERRLWSFHRSPKLESLAYTSNDQRLPPIKHHSEPWCSCEHCPCFYRVFIWPEGKKKVHNAGENAGMSIAILGHATNVRSSGRPELMVCCNIRGLPCQLCPSKISTSSDRSLQFSRKLPRDMDQCRGAHWTCSNYDELSSMA